MDSNTKIHALLEGLFDNHDRPGNPDKVFFTNLIGRRYGRYNNPDLLIVRHIDGKPDGTVAFILQSR